MDCRLDFAQSVDQQKVGNHPDETVVVKADHIGVHSLFVADCSDAVVADCGGGVVVSC